MPQDVAKDPVRNSLLLVPDDEAEVDVDMVKLLAVTGEPEVVEGELGDVADPVPVLYGRLE